MEKKPYKEIFDQMTDFDKHRARLKICFRKMERENKKIKSIWKRFQEDSIQIKDNKIKILEIERYKGDLISYFSEMEKIEAELVAIYESIHYIIDIKI